MWAHPTLSCTLLPIATVTGRSNHRLFIVSAKHSRPQKNIKYDYEEEETETDRELELLKQREIEEETVDSNAYAANSEKISGSAVLLALQKASAQKTSRKLKKKRSKSMNDGEDNRRKQGDAVEDYGTVKPLCIKSDWKDRLDELETQLHQLIHHA